VSQARPRDPSKGGIDVTTFKLVGVISGRNLLALVEGPGGIGYILKTGDVLGDGRVTDITPTSVTFAVSDDGPRSGSVTIRLKTD
jgi:Tfp pilus assembly protein PilP